MRKYIKLRLSLLVFLQFFVPGITCPIMTLYLMNYLGYSGERAGVVLSVSGITTIISSILGTMLSNKFFTVKKLYGLCHLSAGIFMLIYVSQKNFIAVLVMYVLYTLAYGCTNGCVSAIIFENQSNSKKDFGSIQMWGSVGWIFAGSLYSYIWMRGVTGQEATLRLAIGLRFAALVSIIIFLYSLTLPDNKIDVVTNRKSKIPIEAIQILKKPKNLVIAVYEFLVFASFQYYLFAIGPFLQQAKYKEVLLMPIMSIAQFSEAIALAILGYFILKKGFKKVLIVGLCFNLWRFLALSISQSVPVVISALICHGLSSAFFYSGALVYLDANCDDDVARPGIQQIISILSYGIGASVGNLFGGKMTNIFENSKTGYVNYTYFWGTQFIICLVLFIIFISLFEKYGTQKLERMEM